jgi:uncharacterized protein (DUF1697 family)
LIFAIMPHYVAFLRGINLGKRRLPMSRLRTHFKELGFDEVETFIASGNVLFACGENEPARLETRIARHLEASLGYPVDTFVRTTVEVVAIGERQWFPEDGQPGVTIHVAFLHEALPAEIARRLTAIRTAEDEFRVQGREYYWLCRIRSSASTVWLLPGMKALRLPNGTMRNLRSVRKLVAKHLSTWARKRSLDADAVRI